MSVNAAKYIIPTQFNMPHKNSFPLNLCFRYNYIPCQFMWLYTLTLCQFTLLQTLYSLSIYFANYSFIPVIFKNYIHSFMSFILLYTISFFGNAF